jgi:hypothetical protein
MTRSVRSVLSCIGMGLLMSLGASLAHADRGSASDVRKTVEMTMRVTGHVSIAADGQVAGYTLDRPKALPAPVKNNIAKTLPTWRFEPAQPGDGAGEARLPMALSLRASPTPDGSYRLRIVAAHFGEQSVASLPRRLSMQPPKYPGAALAKGYTGVAYILLRVGADGRVADAAAEQVNMYAYGTQSEMEEARDLLAKASLQAAKRWRFAASAPSEAAVKPFWHARVPVAFSFSDHQSPAYGQWRSYVPGPRTLRTGSSWARLPAVPKRSHQAASTRWTVAVVAASC